MPYGFVFLILASAASSAATLALGAPADGTEVTAPQMIDAFEGDFGVHPGQRSGSLVVPDRRLP